MPQLAIQLPVRPRAAARLEGAAAAASEVDYVLSNDGVAVTATGRAAPALLPKADRVVAVLADADIAWHRITVPKAPPARLRAALSGLMEDALLDDADALHLALAPGAAPGQPAWVAGVDKGWLASQLAVLEAAGLSVERVLPAAAPGGDARGHFTIARPGDEVPTLVLVHADGAAVVGLAGTLARALLPPAETPVRWTATPAAATAAEHWLGAPVAVQSDAERTLEALRSPWNLRQFDLVARHRGVRALGEALRHLRTREWRLVRYALVALVVVQLVGLNAAAFQQARAMDARKAEMGALLTSAHPGVRVVYDPPTQMRRETELLRAAAGRLGEADLESLVGAAAAAWPEGQGPVQTLRFENGRLTISATGWSEPQIAQFRDRLRAGGLQVEAAEGKLTVSRAPARVGA